MAAILGDLSKSTNQDVWREHHCMMERIYVVCDFYKQVGLFIMMGARANLLYLRGHHDYMPVLQLPHVIAKKVWNKIKDADIHGKDFYVDWECAGNTIQFTTTDFLSFDLM